MTNRTRNVIVDGMPNTFGHAYDDSSQPDATRWAPREPARGEFFEPEPDSWLGPEPTIRSVGRARVVAGRLGPRRFRLLRRVGYRDPTTGQTWVFPREPDEWTLDFGSMPTLLNWIVPVKGSHFDAFVIHDALVEGELYDPHAVTAQQGTDYAGPKVTREEADRIARDAMGEFGTGFVRRWIGWVGMVIGTIHSPESLGGSLRRARYLIAFWGLIAVLLGLGTISTGDVFGWWNALPWMTGEEWPIRLAWGAVGAIATPVVLSGVWAALFGRWRLWLITGLLLAVLLVPILLTALASVLAVAAERLAARAGLTRANLPDLPVDAFDEDGPTTEER